MISKNSLDNYYAELQKLEMEFPEKTIMINNLLSMITSIDKVKVFDQRTDLEKYFIREYKALLIIIDDLRRARLN